MEDVLVGIVVVIVGWQSTGQLEGNHVTDVVVGTILPIILGRISHAILVLLNLLGQRNGVLLNGHIRSILTVSIQNHLRHGLTVSACSLSLNNQVVALSHIGKSGLIRLRPVISLGIFFASRCMTISLV